MKQIVLKSECVNGKVLTGTICPVCGGKKTAGAGCCKACYQALGGTPAIKAAIQSAVQAVADAYAGMAVADAGKEIQRLTVEEPVFTNVKIPGDMRPMKAWKPGASDYLKCNLPVKGGVVELFVFAEDISAIKKGHLVTGILSFRVREGRDKEKEMSVGYLRLQVVVNPDVRADSQLLVTHDDQLADRLFRDDLPDLEFVEEHLTRRALVGFKAVGSAKRPAQAAA